jgi:hypothetical protein
MSSQSSTRLASGHGAARASQRGYVEVVRLLLVRRPLSVN